MLGVCFYKKKKKSTAVYLLKNFVEHPWKELVPVITYAIVAEKQMQNTGYHVTDKPQCGEYYALKTFLWWKT